MSKVSHCVVIEQETLSDGKRVYVARDLELKGLIAHGDTPDAADANLDEVREERLEMLRKRQGAVSFSNGSAIPQVIFAVRKNSSLAYSSKR